MPDNHIITVPVNGQIQPERPESDLTKNFRAILANNAGAGLDIKTLQKKEAEGKANLIASMSEIKTDVFTPFLLNEYSKTVNDINDLDTNIATLTAELDILSNKYLDSSLEEEMKIIDLKMFKINASLNNAKWEKEKKQKYMLDLHDQFAYKETFKEKGPKKEDMPGGYGAMMAAMMAGAGAGIANAATNQANAAIKEKAKSKKPKQPRGYNSINPDLEKLFKN